MALSVFWKQKGVGTDKLFLVFLHALKSRQLNLLHGIKK